MGFCGILIRSGFPIVGAKPRLCSLRGQGLIFFASFSGRLAASRPRQPTEDDVWLGGLAGHARLDLCLRKRLWKTFVYFHEIYTLAIPRHHRPGPAMGVKVSGLFEFLMEKQRISNAALSVSRNFSFWFHPDG